MLFKPGHLDINLVNLTHHIIPFFKETFPLFASGILDQRRGVLQLFKLIMRSSRSWYNSASCCCTSYASSMVSQPLAAQIMSLMIS